MSINERAKEYTKGTPESETNDEGVSFYEYMNKVDRACMSRCGLSVFDLSDHMWWDAWHECVPYLDALQDLLDEEGFDDSEFDM